jgi:hypothetical protein
MSVLLLLTTNPAQFLECVVFGVGYFVYELAVLAQLAVFAQLIVSRYHSNLTGDWQFMHSEAARVYFEQAENLLLLL